LAAATIRYVQGTEKGARASFLASLGGLEGQGDPVVAVTLAGGPRPVVEHMTLMTTATPAMVFGARNDQPEVLAGLNSVRQGLPKTGPTGVAVKFGGGRKQRQLATRTEILTGPLLLVEGTAERFLGPMLAKHVESRWAQSPFPIGFTELPVGIRDGGRSGFRSLGASP